jgi:hypothetical protein
MQIIMLFIGIAFVLFGLAFFTKRRFGVLGLCLRQQCCFSLADRRTRESTVDSWVLFSLRCLR